VDGSLPSAGLRISAKRASTSHVVTERLGLRVNVGCVRDYLHLVAVGVSKIKSIC
jgi:hypothetical protein